MHLTRCASSMLQMHMRKGGAEIPTAQQPFLCLVAYRNIRCAGRLQCA